VSLGSQKIKTLSKNLCQNPWSCQNILTFKVIGLAISILRTFIPCLLGPFLGAHSSEVVKREHKFAIVGIFPFPSSQRDHFGQRYRPIPTRFLKRYHPIPTCPDLGLEKVSSHSHLGPHVTSSFRPTKDGRLAAWSGIPPLPSVSSSHPRSSRDKWPGELGAGA